MVFSFWFSGLLPKINWALTSIEYTNFTYSLSDREMERLGHFVSSSLRVPYLEVLSFFDELTKDEAFNYALQSNLAKSEFKGVINPNFSFGRRFAWYAIVRIKRPQVVIESGTDKGLGSAVLSQALRKNGGGELFTIDINPKSGSLIDSDYFQFNTHRIHLDSRVFLESFNKKVDFFIHDSDHSFENESLEYELVEPKLSANGLVASDNAGESNAIDLWCKSNDRLLHYFEEKSIEYPGQTSGLALSFPFSKP
jgi:hypothetical protein